MTATNLANKVAAQFTDIPTVQAIAFGGSQSSGVQDSQSDIDLYIYTTEDIPLEKRRSIVRKLGARRADMNLTFWDTGDEWFDLDTDIEIEVMYWRPTWIEEQLDRVLVQHQASLGYTTCFWRTILNSQILFDRDGWFGGLQVKSHQPYPLPLKRAIIAKNHPVLRTVIPSYYGQIKKALGRNDLLSVNHRLMALFASYFDVLFAINEVLHPGEKKILQFVKDECQLTPADLEEQISAIIQSCAVVNGGALKTLDPLLDGLDDLLLAEGYNPDRTLFLA